MLLIALIIGDKEIKYNNMIIAIDGPSASGKSTTALTLSKELDFLYIDTGAMYRAYTLEVLKLNIPVEDEEKVSSIGSEVDIRLINNSDSLKVMLNGKDVSKEIRMNDVTENVSKISTYRDVRERMVELQRIYANNQNVVCEGRDIGTVVFPNANIKIFMIADIEERARRRQKDLKMLNINKDIDTIIKDINTRDELDSNREISPLKRAEDAILIDDTDMSFDEQLKFIKELTLAKNEGKL
jgi:cytidylate kinase